MSSIISNISCRTFPTACRSRRTSGGRASGDGTASLLRFASLHPFRGPALSFGNFLGAELALGRFDRRAKEEQRPQGANDRSGFHFVPPPAGTAGRQLDGSSAAR